MTECTLIIVRGAPGSGKSTFAKAIQQKYGFKHFETDMFENLYCENHINKDLLAAAHRWCQQTVRHHLSHGCSTIVSNTFTKLWEMKPYLDMALNYNTRVLVYHMQNQFKSIHNVPEFVVERMTDTYQPHKLDYAVTQENAHETIAAIC